MMTSKKTATKNKDEKKNPINVSVASPSIDEKALTKQATDLSEKVKTLTVTDQTTYNEAAALLAPVKQYITYLVGIYKKSKDALNSAVKTLRDEEKRVIGPRLEYAEDLERSIKKKMSDFIIAEEDRKRKERAEAQRKADEEAEKERKRLAKLAEKAENKGQEGKAEQLKQQASAVTSAPVAAQQAVSYAGTGTMGRDDIAITITDPRLFLKYLLDMNAPVTSLIEFKTAKVKEYVKTIEVMEGEVVQKAPGITVERTKIISAKG